jgi:hypothetical protein
MTLEEMELRLARWKTGVWAALGASAAMVLASASDGILAGRSPDPDQYSAWLLTWFLVQCAVVAPAVRLTLSRKWRRLPIELRLNPVFGSLAAAWLTLVSFGLRVVRTITIDPGNVYFFILLVGAVVGWAYFRVRTKILASPESMFP